MDKTALAERLGVPPGGNFQVVDVHYAHWGSEVTFTCTYQPTDETTLIRFRMLLNDCREMHWRVYAYQRPQESQTLPQATLVNILLGRDSHRKPMNMLTDFFGVTVLYGTLAIEK